MRFANSARKADAAVRGRMPRHDALMHRDAGPGDALHVGHRRAAVEIGLVVDALFQDAEHALRRRMTGHAGRDLRMRDRHAAGIERQLLLLDRDDDVQRAGRKLLGVLADSLASCFLLRCRRRAARLIGLDWALRRWARRPGLPEAPAGLDRQPQAPRSPAAPAMPAAITECRRHDQFRDQAARHSLPKPDGISPALVSRATARARSRCPAAGALRSSCAVVSRQHRAFGRAARRRKPADERR